MKKLLALALAVVMMMAIALPAFAADGSESDHVWGDTDKVQASDKYTNFDQVVLEYGVYQAYEVTIPADINFGYMNPNGYVLEDVRNVAVNNAVISGRDSLVITVASQFGWTMTDTFGKSTAVSYTATLGTLEYTDAAAELDDVTRPAAIFSEKYDNDATVDNEVVCTVLVVGAATGNTGTAVNNNANIDITFTTAGTAQEGLYRDTLTFTVEIIEDYASTFAAERTVA